MNASSLEPVGMVGDGQYRFETRSKCFDSRNVVLATIFGLNPDTADVESEGVRSDLIVASLLFRLSKQLRWLVTINVVSRLKALSGWLACTRFG